MWLYFGFYPISTRRGRRYTQKKPIPALCLPAAHGKSSVLAYWLPALDSKMKINLKTPLFIMVSLMTASVHAQSYQLTVNGRVTIQPCAITVDSVQLGDVPITEFLTSSIPASRYSRPFDVRLQNCELGTLSTASLRFTGTMTGSNSVLALSSGAGVATGIGVQITTNDSSHGSTGTPVKFDGSEGYAFRIASGKSSYSFLASYIRSPTAPSRSAGLANATATVTLTYS